jgi:8-oxo-dGTP pyrophosphatase MutT (NUDIX family)
METNCSVTVIPVMDKRIGFIRRASRDTLPGRLVAPGGKIEISDGSPMDGVPYNSVESAARRELQEETKIDVLTSQLKYFCSLTLPSNGRVVISLYCLLQKDQASAAVNIVWLTRSDILGRNDFAPGMQQEALMLLNLLNIR